MYQKKKIRLGYLIVFLFFAGFLLLHMPMKANAAAKLNRTSKTMYVGDKMTLQVTGTTKKVKWKSSNSAVAKVTSKGVVLARKKGTAVISATVDKKTYNCKVTVNKTFKLEQDSTSIKNIKRIRALLTVDGAITYSISDPKICSISYDEWEGDFLPILVTPKKVGSTTVKFTNSVNSESCTLKVNVKALPVNATIQQPQISTGGKYFIVGENTIKLVFKQNRASTATKVRFYDEDNLIVREIKIGALGAKKKATVEWDGKDDYGEPVEGTFTYSVIADSTVTKGTQKITVYAHSPFGNGDGSENRPFLVSNVEELLMIPEYDDSYFELDNDIDFEYDTSNMHKLPLFDEEHQFQGSIDGIHGGKVYQIKNYTGFSSIFGYVGVNGQIVNMKFVSCQNISTGALVATINEGILDNCSTNTECSVKTSGGSAAAMLAENNKESGRIRNCRSVAGKVQLDVSVKNDDNTGYSNWVLMKAGGLVVENSGSIINCTSQVEIDGKITVSGAYTQTNSYIILSGGIAACQNSGFIINCRNEGSMTNNISLGSGNNNNNKIGFIYEGFIAGQKSTGSDISNCEDGTGSGLPIYGT